MSGLGKRFLTALIAVPLLIAIVGWLPWYAFGLVAIAALTLTMVELFSITLVEETPEMRRWGVVLGGATLTALVFSWQAPARYALGWSPPGLGIVVLVVMAVFATFLFGRGRRADLHPIPGRIGQMGFGILYIALLGTHIIWLTRLPHATGSYTHRAAWVFLVLACVFLSDTGGYFFGKGLGGPKLYPSVSPNKTWAGLAGCIVGAGLGAFGTSWFLLPLLTPVDCILIGVGVGILGQIGDFSESLIKRAYQVKDSGSILPGHGGLLDRLDAMLFAGPFLFYYAVWIVLPRHAL